MSKTKRTRHYECAVLWTDHTWTEDHYSTGRSENEATQKLLNKLEKEGATNVSHVTVVRECDEDENDEETPINHIREIIKYADAADAQLIDALNMIEIMLSDPKSSPIFVRAQLDDLANDVEPQDQDMASDLRYIATCLEIS